MPNNNGPITPERQRRFEAARRALEQMCHVYPPRKSDLLDARWHTVTPEEIERARWLMVSMGLARGTPGGAAIAALAERGYAVATVRFSFPQGDIVALDTPGLISLGGILPALRRRWKAIEAIALDANPEDLPKLRWCTAHAALRIRGEVAAEGHDLG
jgi:hypothetical protein